jgi:hypothetical protein
MKSTEGMHIDEIDLRIQILISLKHDVNTHGVAKALSDRRKDLTVLQAVKLEIDQREGFIKRFAAKLHHSDCPASRREMALLIWDNRVTLNQEFTDMGVY